MAKGVKKIKWTGQGGVLKDFSSSTNNIICIQPNQMVTFEVSEWYDDTTAAEKDKTIIWLWQNQKKTTIFHRAAKHANTPFGVNLPKKLCGSYAYYLEASLYGAHDSRNTGLHVYGKCEEKVTTASWSKNENSSDISEIHYGHCLFVTLETEGVNGDNLTLELYSSKNPDFSIQKVKAKCINGKILNAKFSTLSYKMFVPGIASKSESYFIKVTDVTGKHIANTSGNDKIISFTIVDKHAIPTFEIPTNNIPYKIGVPDNDPEKKENGVCVCKDYDLIWGNKIGCKERKKVVEVAANLGVKPNWLMSVMALETAKTFSPSIDNGIGYVGLIQFGKDAAKTVKTTQQKLVKMTFVEQMDYVEKFLTGKKDKYKTLVDLYLAVLYPNACGHGGEKNYIVLKDKAYRNNPLFFQEEDEITRDKKGKIISRHPKVNGHTFVWEVDLAIQSVFSQGLTKKTKSFSCEFNTETKTPSNCKCTKTHIDLRPAVKWHSQFDSQWGDKKAQNVACWKASQQILTNSGLGSTSGYPDGAIQMAREIDKHTKIEYLSNGLKAGIKYIDEQLEKNNPIIVGVNHDLNYRGEKNNDHTTDHFVVIVGRDCDDNGAFYIFYEVGTQYKKSGSSDDNKLYILDNRIEGKTAYSSTKVYQVAQVRKNN